MKRIERNRNKSETTMISATKHQTSSDETKIDVFVRCRGRSEREVQENSGVVVSTDGAKSKTVELSMGANALSNKTYSFDGVFSPAADQQMIFDEVVRPVLDEVLKGFNCTIFAYGQTGTGKTYTMSGDISDHALLPDDAGIIPRVLHSLFLNLNSLPDSPTSGSAPENAVKVSYIELYNEELRDLFSSEDKSSLKMFEGDSRRGAATVVHGMEEQYITSARKGIQLLRDGSHKRQVAATKCNDLSSRSHTVFTVTVYTKQTLASGEEVLSSGKLNLVDLAGSENIGRSGAENKRATEAGLINKSLLTLGRVINALVDRSAHIPYRESKLTRLLQDSLGGRTKTCIIATLSPIRSNLDETISSLDYAFRAKNIRNKPQVNQVTSKKTLLKEFVLEMERLKSELNATRQRNGIYMTKDTYEELRDETDSLRTLVKEQREKIDTIESKLVRKGHDLRELTSNFENLKKDCEATKGILNSTKSLLEDEKVAMSHAKRMLNDETSARQQHERAEQQLASLNRRLLATLDQSTTDVTDLHLNLERRSELHARNQGQWIGTRQDVEDTTVLIDGRLTEFQTEQKKLVDALAGRMHSFIKYELDELSTARADLIEQSKALEQAHKEAAAQIRQPKDQVNEVLHDVKRVSEELKNTVRRGLINLGEAAERIPGGVLQEIETFHVHLKSSYLSLGEDFRKIVDDTSKGMAEQREAMQRLCDEMTEANQRLVQDQMRPSDCLSEFVGKERAVRDQEKSDLMQCIQNLVETKFQQQELRLEVVARSSSQLNSARQSHSTAGALFVDGNKQVTERLRNLGDKLIESRKAINTRFQSDFAIANKHMEKLKDTTSSVHHKTAKIVKEQVQHLDTDTHVLENVACRIHEQNDTLQNLREKHFPSLALTLQNSFASLSDAFTASFDRIEGFNKDIPEQIDKLQETLPLLDKDAFIRRQLAELARRAELDKLEEYIHTGKTPKRRKYSYSTAPSQTSNSQSFMEPMSLEHHDNECLLPRPSSPSKMLVFADDRGSPRHHTKKVVRPGTSSGIPSLHELDVNTMMETGQDSNATNTESMAHSKDDGAGNALTTSHPLKRSAIVSASAKSKVPAKKRRSCNAIIASNPSTSNHVTQKKGESPIMPSPVRSMRHKVV